MKRRPQTPVQSAYELFTELLNNDPKMRRQATRAAGRLLQSLVASTPGRRRAVVSDLRERVFGGVREAGLARESALRRAALTRATRQAAANEYYRGLALARRLRSREGLGEVTTDAGRFVLSEPLRDDGNGQIAMRRSL